MWAAARAWDVAGEVMWEVVMLGAAALAAGLGDGRAVVRVVRRKRERRRVARPGREEGMCMVGLRVMIGLCCRGC